MCGSVRYRDAETTVPACHLSRRFIQTAPLQNVHVEMPSNKLFVQAVHQNVDVEEFPELFD
jgi:hypothetical protein